MLIPVKCFTCGMVIADKYRTYLQEVRLRKTTKGMDPHQICYLTAQQTEKTVEGVVMDEMNIINICCRRHFLTHVDII